MDLGKEFFLIRFSIKEDYEAVLRNGPWFIGENFLSIRPWEPNFKPPGVNISSVAIWVRLNELPIEYYHEEALQIIGNAVGKVLRIDTHTASETRGRFARLCIQVDVGKPLTTALLIGGKEQLVCYEGIQRLCFSCGRISHQRENCPYVVREVTPQAREAEGKKDVWANQGDVGREFDIPGSSSGTSKDSGVHKDMVGEDTLVENAKDMYGPWIMVSRRRSGSKVIKKVVPNDPSTSRMTGEGKFGLIKAGQREGKRKVASESSMLEAQIANVVQSIVNGPNYTNKSPGQFHVEKNRLNTEVSLSVRGKKGIARQMASLSVTKKEVDNGVAKGENTLAKYFLENLSVNGNEAFNFKAKSYEYRPRVSPNGQ